MTQNRPLPATEVADPRYAGLDTWPDTAVLTALAEGQERAVAALAPALPALAAAAERATASLSRGGRLIYLAAGSPALIALGDMLELPQTYGIARDRLVCLMAGGHEITRNLSGTDEDRADLAEQAIAEIGTGADDCVVAISASGSTPYTVAGLAAARRAGAATVGIAGNPGAALFAAADVAVLLAVGAEVISGSTRMGAGTAQKAALNLFSTLVGVRLGHVHDNFMINVNADNDKLRKRAARMVGAITGADEDKALEALGRTGGSPKLAALLAAGAASPADAETLLARHGGHLRPALAELGR